MSKFCFRLRVVGFFVFKDGLDVDDFKDSLKDATSDVHVRWRSDSGSGTGSDGPGRKLY